MCVCVRVRVCACVFMCFACVLSVCVRVYEAIGSAGKLVVTTGAGAACFPIFGLCQKILGFFQEISYQRMG